MLHNMWRPAIKDAAGGYIVYNLHDGDMTVWNEGGFAFCGFKCERQNLQPWHSDEYESRVHTSFFRFEVPDVSGTVTSCKLYLRYSHGKVVEANNHLDYPLVQVWAKYYQNYSEFPWQKLEEDDYSSSWTQYGTIYTSIKEMVAAASGWYEVDITSAFQHAVAEDWDYFAIRLKSSYDAPDDWDWDHAPMTGLLDWWGTNEECWLAFHGATTQGYSADMPGTYQADTLAHTLPYAPILKIVYDVPSPPTAETSTVNAVAADPKAKLCLAGTASGKVWRIYKTNSTWQKDVVFEDGTCEITALMVDPTYNFKDYPNYYIVWVGTSSGRLYRGMFGSRLNRVDQDLFGTSIIEIRNGGIDSSKVVVAATGGVWVTVDGGLGWSKVLVAAVTGIFVSGDEIQVIYGSGGMTRSPDFGVNWYVGSGVASTATDIAFSRTKITKSVIVTNGYLQKYSSGTPAFVFANGATIAGNPTTIDANDELAVIGTSSNLYQTTDWGETANVIVSGANVKMVSLGGTYLYTP